MKERITDNKLETIVAQLAADGFPSDLETALKVQRASMSGLLCWTKRRLTTDDGSRLDFRAKRQHAAQLKLTTIAAPLVAAEREAVVCTNSWAGRLETPVRVLLQTSTPKRYRGRFQENSVKHRAGAVALVPRYAVRFTDGKPAP